MEKYCENKMPKSPKLAILVEKKAALRKEIAGQLDFMGIPKILRYADPQYARREVESWNKSGLLVIGNSNDLESCFDLVAFCRARKACWTIIVLDHLNSEESVSGAFAAGADDVLHVPFCNVEFSARLSLRLTQARNSQTEKEQPAPPIFDDILLTQTEQKILNYLIRNKGKTVTRNELARYVDDKDWVYGDRKYDVHITNIRNKLKEKLDERYIVKSVRSVGYYFQESND